VTALVLRALFSGALVLGLPSACARPRVGDTGAVADTARAQPPRPAAVTADDIRNRPGAPVEVILAGRFPGVEVTRTADGGIAIRIRGGSSVNAGNEPLYVLDGMPIAPRPGGSLAGINPYEIASIEVLRDPARTAAYGVRGANGVIIIKTKQP
jgi:TonB-dependent SusC/RagA subfamily outer membrane receptor